MDNSWKERVITEKAEVNTLLLKTDERLDKLNQFLVSEGFVGLDEHQQQLLKKQSAIMDAVANGLMKYRDILSERLGNK